LTFLQPATADLSSIVNHDMFSLYRLKPIAT